MTQDCKYCERTGGVLDGKAAGSRCVRRTCEGRVYLKIKRSGFRPFSLLRILNEIHRYTDVFFLLVKIPHIKAVKIFQKNIHKERKTKNE